MCGEIACVRVCEGGGGGGVYCTMYMYVGRVHGTALGTTYGNQPTMTRLVSANQLYKKKLSFFPCLLILTVFCGEKVFVMLGSEMKNRMLYCTVYNWYKNK